MGTRSLTHVLDEDGTVLVTIYRQFDGYPSGIGYELADYLADRVITNGIGALPKTSNGMGCLAASLVASLKGETVGNVYIMTPGSAAHGEEYVYSVTLSPARTLRLSCATADECGAIAQTLYDGPPEDFRAMVKEEAR